MPIPAKYKAPFAFGSFYHVYNRCVDGQQLFYFDSHYRRFLSKYQIYLSDVLDLYAYALIPNHFHLLCSVKQENDCVFTVKESKHLEKGIIQIQDIISDRFKKLFISHSLTLKNRVFIDTNVFSQKFKHILVDADQYFGALMSYIHLNPIKHKLNLDFQNYIWTSYQRILQEDRFLRTEYIFDWFGTRERFQEFHIDQSREFESRVLLEEFSLIESI
jgi:putative transposase